MHSPNFRAPAVHARTILSLCSLGAALTLAGCASFESIPLEPTKVLAGLDALEWSAAGSAAQERDGDESTGLGPRQLTAFALRTNPRLAAVRAELGIHRALLVEAGLLEDPELSWDAMDILASRIVDGGSSQVDSLAGIGVLFPLQRPGERKARIRGAKGRRQEARHLLAKAEWELARDIHLAFEEAQAADKLLVQSREVAELAGSTYDYFARAKEAGAATAIQANLAQGELLKIRLDAVAAESHAQEARQVLNALLGLPPGTALTLRSDAIAPPAQHLAEDAATLTAHALETRPDLAALGAAYRAAEEDLRLAISSQYPRIAIGTGIAIELPLFSKFGRPAIATAKARRGRLEQEFTAAVHAVRRDIASLCLRRELAQRELAMVEEALLPNAEQSLELSRESLAHGEITLLETLALQSALIQARTRHIETQATLSKRSWELLAASGWLLGHPHTNNAVDQVEHQEDVR